MCFKQETLWQKVKNVCVFCMCEEEIYKAKTRLFPVSWSKKDIGSVGRQPFFFV